MPAVSFQAIATTLFLPPLLLVLACLACGVVVLRRHRVVGTLLIAGSSLIVLLSTSWVAGQLRGALQAGLAVPADIAPAQAPAQAIVVLSADVTRGADNRVDLGAMTLERLRAGAVLHRRTGLPILVTGGSFGPGAPSVAALMARSLADDFGLEARWVEAWARDTRENAVLSAALLRAAEIERVLVVTHAWHMRRSLAAFARTGLTALPAPVRMEYVPDAQLRHFIPRTDHLNDSWLALREWAGILVYRLRDGAAMP